MSRPIRGNQSLMDQIVRELGAGRRPGPFLLVWRWRWEWATVAAAWWLAHAVSPWVLLVAIGAVAAACAVLPALRRLMRDRFWCVATQHRLRTGFRESGVRSWSGRMPAIVWTSARAHGERVLLSCPAGVDVARIAEARGELAAACWAIDVTVTGHPRHANLVVVDVVRRDSGAEQP